MIRVVVADDNPVIRGGVKSLLESSDGIVVVAEASNGREAVELAEREHPDLVLCDVRMPVMDGIEAVARMHQTTRVLMLTYAEEENLVAGAIRAGASGYLVHGRFAPDDLEQAVRQVASGHTVLSPAVVTVVFDALRKGPERLDEQGPLALTEREQEIANLLARGRSNRDIAADLFISEKTVKNHINHIYAKLGVASRAEAIALWLGVAGASAPGA
jgi:DNA-binding NarL/FixJ family response regulator